jgi:CO/xanthine dehydrogenase Mo-binding subunit
MAAMSEPALAQIVALRSADIPAAIDITFVDEFDAHVGPLGAKGIGELSATGIAAADCFRHSTGRRGPGSGNG